MIISAPCVATLGAPQISCSISLHHIYTITQSSQRHKPILLSAVARTLNSITSPYFNECHIHHISCGYVAEYQFRCVSLHHPNSQRLRNNILQTFYYSSCLFKYAHFYDILCPPSCTHTPFFRVYCQNLCFCSIFNFHNHIHASCDNLDYLKSATL